MSIGTNRERIEQNNTKLSEIKNKISTLPDYKGDVKLFATVEEMQADTTAKEGDLAVVYRSEINNATVDSKFQTATFPETVVLDTAMTDYVDVRYRAVDDSKRFDCFGELDSSMFRMDCWSESGEVRIQYESSDGITYTRTDSTGNPVDFGCEIYYEMSEMWNDVIGKFIQIGGNTFEGLYKYKTNNIDKNAIRFIPLTEINPAIDDSSENMIINTYIGDTRTEAYDLVAIREVLSNYDEFSNVLLNDNCYIYLDKNNHLSVCIVNIKNESGSITNYTTAGSVMLNNSDVSQILGVGTCWGQITDSNRYELKKYIINLDNKTVALDDSIVAITNYYSNTTGRTEPIDLAIFIDDSSTIPVNISNATIRNQCLRTLTLTNEETYYQDTNNNKNDINYPSCYNLYDAYLIATTQLTATSDCVYNTEFYGKNGVETGTLGDEISTSTGFINAIELYDKLETINIDKDINLNNVLYNSNIQSLPKINVDSVINIGGLCNKCTNLINANTINAPNVTTANAIFSQCSSMITAPEIILPKATITRHILSHCTSLVNVPVYDFPLATNLDNMFYNDTALSDESLNNIMQTCINLTAFTALGENLTLKYIGLTEEQANKCKTLSNYSAFTSAGWTTGY